MAERHQKWTQLELAKWAYDTFQLPKIPSQGTISRLLAKKAIYMNCKEHEKDANRIRKPNNLLVRRILQEWISQSIWNGIPITSPIIQDTAQAVWHRIPAEQREGNGSFTYKWISNFLSKMDVNVSILDEETPKTPKVWTFEERSHLKEYFSKINPKNLFTLDETFLAYNLPLDYAQYETSSIQRRIEVATVMLCANLDGSEKIKPLVVGKYKSYRSFRNYFPNEPNDPVSQSLLGEKMATKFDISYHSNRKSWLTSNLFHNWLARWDKRLVADNRKIWIVLDDSCSHRIINLHLQNITLIYTSANSRFLPFNWGVLDEFKTRYRIQQYDVLINIQKKIERNTNKPFFISFEQSQLTMSNAFKFIKKAWDDIPVDTIRANWKSSGIIPPNFVKLNENVSMAFKKNEALESKLDTLCHEFRCVKQWEYEMMLDLNIENKNTNFLSTEELVESAIVDEMEPEHNYASSVLPSAIGSQIGTEDLEESNVDLNVGINNNSNTDLPLLNPQNNFEFPTFGETSHVLSRNESNNSHLPANPVDGDMDSNLNKLLLDSFNPNNQNSLYNVSTFIDRPNLFINNDVDLNLDDVQITQAPYFNDIFTDNENNENTNALTNSNSLKPSPNSDSTSTNNNNDMSSSNTDNNIMTTNQVNTEFEVPELNHLLTNSTSNSNILTSNALPASFPVVSSPSSVTGHSDYTLSSLHANIDIAKSLGVIIKHNEANDIQFSKPTIDEVKLTYMNLLKKIKKTRKSLHQSKIKTDPHLESILRDPNLSENVVITNNNTDSDAANIHLDGNPSFF